MGCSHGKGAGGLEFSWRGGGTGEHRVLSKLCTSICFIAILFLQYSLHGYADIHQYWIFLHNIIEFGNLHSSGEFRLFHILLLRKQKYSK